jgi:hypothetical protein
MRALNAESLLPVSQLLKCRKTSYAHQIYNLPGMIGIAILWRANILILFLGCTICLSYQTLLDDNDLQL